MLCRSFGDVTPITTLGRSFMFMVLGATVIVIPRMSETLKMIRVKHSHFHSLKYNPRTASRSALAFVVARFWRR